MKFVLMIALLAIAACSPAAEEPAPVEIAAFDLSAGVYTLDADKTTLEWEASRIAGRPHTGLIDITEGTVTVTEESATGEFVIDMDSMREEGGSEQFIGHVKNDDFFGVEQFPTSTLRVTKVQATAPGEYIVTADLTIRDQTNTIVFPAQVTQVDGVLAATAEFEIDRTRWGINYDSGSIFTTLGDRAIKDEIIYRLELTLLES